MSCDLCILQKNGKLVCMWCRLHTFLVYSITFHVCRSTCGWKKATFRLISTALVYYWSTICNAGSNLNWHWSKVSCFLQAIFAVQPPNYLTGIFTHLKYVSRWHDSQLNFTWVNIIQIWENGGQDFQILLIDVAFYLNPYSAGIDFSRQNLTTVDVRFWRLKSIPAL